MKKLEKGSYIIRRFYAECTPILFACSRESYEDIFNDAPFEVTDDNNILVPLIDNFRFVIRQSSITSIDHATYYSSYDTYVVMLDYGAILIVQKLD